MSQMRDIKRLLESENARLVAFTANSHIKARVAYGQHQFTMIFPVSPSCPRAAANNKAWLRRKLRALNQESEKAS